MNMSKGRIWAIAVVGLVAVAVLLYLIAVLDVNSSSDSRATATPQPMAWYRAGQIEVGIATEPTTPRVGDNRLIIGVRDADGSPLSGVPVTAHAEMPAMGQMPAMRAPADLVETSPGQFEGSMNLSMRGAWPLTVAIQDPRTGDLTELKFDLATDRTELEITAGAASIEGTASASSPARDSAMSRFRAGELEIGVALDPETPRVGNNRVIVEVREAEGNAAVNTGVSAFAEMPAMGAMPAMRAPADLEQTAPGRFEGSMNLSMRGEWPLTVDVTDARGERRQLRFDLATDRAGLTISSGGTSLGANTAGADEANVITIDSRRRQMIGVETGEVAYRPFVVPIRAVGKVTYDERQLSHITLKFDGFIGDLLADYVGAPIEGGQPLFTVYSPELLAAQQEYLETAQRRAGTDSTFLRAARQRLRLWDMSDAEIAALERRGTPEDYVAIHAPRSGTLIERNIADGSAARTGETLLTIANLSRVWIEAEVFEADLELVEAGMRASVSLPYLPGRRFEADIEYVYPYLEGATRTGRVRLTLDNPEGALKPDMYAEVSLRADLGERLAVPEEAVIVAGESRVVFVDLGEGRLRPTRIQTGRRAQGLVEVLSGLSAGDRVVTSGNFLLAAETRLRTGLEQW